MKGHITQDPVTWDTEGKKMIEYIPHFYFGESNGRYTNENSLIHF